LFNQNYDNLSVGDSFFESCFYPPPLRED